MKQQIVVLNLALLLGLSGCVTGGKDKGTNKDRDDNKSDSRRKNRVDEREREDDFYISGNLDTMTMSLRNNPLTSKRVDRKEAASLAQKLESAIKSSKGDDRKAQVALISLRRIAGEGLGSVLDASKELVSLEMKKDVNHGIPEFAKLELMLAGIQAKKYSFAEYFIADLVDSKKKEVQAAAFTAQGIIFAEDDKLPEAVESWTKALQIDSSYEAALLNIGFVALKYGDFARAKKMLGGLQGDWFAAYGLITASRLTKDAKRANELCNKVLEAKPRFKPALINCALNEYQGNGNPDKALAILDKVTKIPGNSNLDERAFLIKQNIQEDKRSRPDGKKKK